MNTPKSSALSSAPAPTSRIVDYSRCSICGCSGPIVQFKSNFGRCLNCAAKTASVSKIAPPVAIDPARRAILARLSMLENEIPAATSRAATAADRLVTLKLERRNLRSQLNGTHGEATNEDDMQREENPPFTHMEEWGLLTSAPSLTGRQAERLTALFQVLLRHDDRAMRALPGSGFLSYGPGVMRWVTHREMDAIYAARRASWSYCLHRVVERFVDHRVFVRDPRNTPVYVWRFALGCTGAYFASSLAVLVFPVPFFIHIGINLCVLSFVHFVVVSQLNGNNGEATNTDDLASALLSTKGPKKFSVDNDAHPGRREELVHASPKTIRKVISAKPKIRFDTKKLKRTAEKAEDKARDSARDIDRCRREFSKLLYALDPDTNYPQFGFNMGELLSKWNMNPLPFIQTCREMATSITTSADTFNSITEAVTSALPWVTTFLKATSLVTAVAICLYAQFTKRRALALISSGLLLTYFTVQGMSTSLPDWFLPWLEGTKERVEKDIYVPPNDSVFPDEGENQPQAGEAISIDQSLVSKVMVTVFSAGFFTLSDKKKGTFDLLKDFVVHFPSVIKGVDSIVEFSSKFILKALNYLRGKLGLDVFESLLENQSPFLHWMHNVEVFLDRVGNHDPEARPSASTLGVINAFIAEGRVHSQFLKSLTDDTGAHSRLGALMNRLAKARDELKSFNSNIVSYRPEPFCLYIYSKPGKGKSTWIDLLNHAWLKEVLPPEDFALYCRMKAAYVYNRTPETKFWDGYANQIVCNFDDFLQALESAGMDSAALDLIRCVNGKPALLHQANLADKGSSYFTSEFVTMSSNMQIPKSDAVYDQDALIRRPNIYVEIDFQEDIKISSPYLNSDGVDKELLMIINARESWDDRCSVYRLRTYKIDATTRTVVYGPDITSRQILDMAIAHRKFAQAKFDHTLAYTPSPAKFQVADALLAKFRAAARVPEPVVSPVNVPQGRPDIQAKVGTNKDYEHLISLLEDWLCYVEVHGLADTRSREHRELLLEYLTSKHVSWAEFIDVFHPHVAQAEYKHAELAHRTESFRKFQVDLPYPAKVDNKTFFERYFSSFTNWLKSDLGEQLWSFFSTYWKWLFGIGVALAAGVGLYKSMTAWAAADNEPQSMDVKHKSQVNRRADFRRFVRRANPVNQAQGSDAMSACLSKVLFHNYHIQLGPKSLDAIGQVQLITDRVGVVNAHTVEMIAAKARDSGLTHVWLRKFGKKVAPIAVPVDKFIRANRGPDVSELDIVMVYLDDCSIGAACDFRRNIPSIADFDGHSQVCVMVPTLTPTNEYQVPIIDPRAYINRPTGKYEYVDRDLTGKVVSKTSYSNEWNISYCIKTEPGYCGLPVIIDGLAQGRYLGAIHKCFNGSYGGAAPLFIEWVDRELDHILKVFDNPVIIHHEDNSELKPPPTNFPQCFPAEVIGVTAPFHGSTESKLVQLPHAGMFDLKTAPAVLDTVLVDGHYVNPYIKNREKLPSVLPNYPDVPDLRRLISGIVNDPSRPDAADHKMWRRTMTFEEALYGINGTVFTGLDMSTSVGYPKVLSGFTNKAAYLKDPTRLALFKVEVEHCIRKLEAGERPLFLHMDVLKDERRPLEKVADVSTRTVVPSPLTLLVINRMYFGGFASWTQINKITNGITIGMNPYSQEWDAMCRELFIRDYKQYAGDSSGFDLNQHQEPLRGIFAAINDWYNDPVANKVRTTLSLDFMFPRHVSFPVHITKAMREALLREPISDDPFVVSSFLKIVNAADWKTLLYIYICVTGHASGSYLTALINSWYSLIKPVIVAQYHIRDLDTVLDIFRRKMIRSMTLGDDFITSVHPDIQHILNAQSFAAFSLSYGMKVTREDKTPITCPFPVEPPVFLKRLLRRDPAIPRWVGALNKDAIIDMICWMRKSSSRPPTDLEIQGVFNTGLCELSLWGRDEFNALAPKFREAAELTLGRSYCSGIDVWEHALARALSLERCLLP